MLCSRFDSGFVPRCRITLLLSDNGPMNSAANRICWHVLGAGAVGCLWAACLHRAGSTPTLLLRDGETVQAYHGIILETAAGERLECRAEAQEIGAAGDVAHLLVCTKATEVLQALEAVKHRLRADACVVLMQNGMGYQDKALATIAPARLFCALSTEGVLRIAPFEVRHTGAGLTRIGRYPRGSLEEASGLIQTLPHRQLAMEALSEVLPAMWRKLAINCAINALTVIHDCENGALVENPLLRNEFEALCHETARVLDALGYRQIALQLPGEARDVAVATARNISSMLQDARAGRKTEVDAINGFLVLQAEAAGLDCPLNRALWQGVRSIGAGG